MGTVLPKPRPMASCSMPPSHDLSCGIRAPLQGGCETMRIKGSVLCPAHKMGHKGPHSVAPGQAPSVFSTTMGKPSHGTCVLAGGGGGSVRREGLFGRGQDHRPAPVTSARSLFFLPGLHTVPTAGGTPLLCSLQPATAHLPVPPKPVRLVQGVGKIRAGNLFHILISRGDSTDRYVLCRGLAAPWWGRWSGSREEQLWSRL